MNGSLGENRTEGTIWVCGRPSFLRQAMSSALQDTFGTALVRQEPELEPPALRLPDDARWMIWFINLKYEAGVALIQLPVAPDPLNLIVVEGDGHVLLRRAEQIEFESLDVSLGELLFIMKTTVDERHSSSCPAQGDADDTHWQ